MSDNTLKDYYVFITPRNNPSGPQYVKIIDGPLMGAELNIKNVSFEKPTKKNNFTPKLNIDYDMIAPPIEDINQLTDQDISNIIGMVVEDIITRHHPSL